MKTAIFHTALDNIGGAEVVTSILSKELKADVYTTNIDKDKIEKMGFGNSPVISIGNIPTNPPFRQQAALMRFKSLNLRNKYTSYIIAGDWALSVAINHKPNLWYVHSPIREIWDLYDFTRENMVPKLMRPAFDMWVNVNRNLNLKYIRHVQRLACNSINTQKRIKKYLNREAVVIHPPIETSRYYYKQSGDYWLSVNRFIKHKRIEIQIEAFRQMPKEKLIIVGSYEKAKHFRQYAEYIKKIAPENVKIISWVDSAHLIKLYAHCKGFVTTAKDEDFGMAVVEAMASGKPVVAPNEGGFKETVLHNQTGYLIDDITSQKLIEAVKLVGRNPEIYKEGCLKQAKKFDTSVFIEKIKNVMKDTSSEMTFDKLERNSLSVGR